MKKGTFGPKTLIFFVLWPTLEESSSRFLISSPRVDISMVTHTLSNYRNFGDKVVNTNSLVRYFYWEYFIFEIRIDGLSSGLSPGELPCMYFDWFLVRGIPLPAAQLFVIAIESILRRGVGNLTSACVQVESIISVRVHSLDYLSPVHTVPNLSDIGFTP